MYVAEEVEWSVAFDCDGEGYPYIPLAMRMGDEPRRVLSELGEIRQMDVVLPTREGIKIRTRCVSRSTEHQQILLDRLGLRLPKK